MDISTYQKLPNSFNPGYNMLKNGVVVKWPEDMLGCLVMGEICYAAEKPSSSSVQMMSFEWAEPAAMELVCVRMRRPFAANRLLTVV